MMQVKVCVAHKQNMRFSGWLTSRIEQNNLSYKCNVVVSTDFNSALSANFMLVNLKRVSEFTGRTGLTTGLTFHLKLDHKNAFLDIINA